jgi:undecaprenyl-diphosphatase
MTEEVVNALGMGALQGVTEFLPISSDGHLALFAMLMHVPDMSLALVLLLHAGTLIATATVFRGDLFQVARVFFAQLSKPSELLRTEEGNLLVSLVVASVPTAVIGLLLEDRVEALATVRWIVGAGFLVSAAAVYSTRHRKGASASLTVAAAFLLGVVQGIAVLPGVSRSGLTIACAMALGMSGPAAFRFSFLLSLPVVAGAIVLKLGEPGVLASMNGAAWLAAFVSMIVGYVALRGLGTLLQSGRFWLFSLYLVPLGAALVLLDWLGA